MIDRYSSKEMKAIWSDENRFASFLEVEKASVLSLAELGIVPYDDAVLINEKADFSVERIKELEEITHHDVIAFTRTVSEYLGDEKKWFHYGLTSTDVVDSANALMLQKANDIIEGRALDFLNDLKEKALKYKNLPCIGRTHGIHAEITSFGLKWLNFYDELRRNINIFNEARQEVEVIKLSGAVGNYVLIPVETEELTAEKLGLGYAKISTQVLSRDRFSAYIMSLGLIASTLEKIATEIRLLSRTEIKEVEEYFSSGQKGSSAMPHKRNPIASENICGCSRIVRSYINVALENNILWSERDISHSSAERIMLPDVTTLIDYMLTRMHKIVSKLTIFEENIVGNIWLTNGLVFSGRVLSKMINLGFTREYAYDLIQQVAFQTMNGDKSFDEYLMESEIAKYLTIDEIKDCFDEKYYLKNVNKIYQRILGE